MPNLRELFRNKTNRDNCLGHLFPKNMNKTTYRIVSHVFWHILIVTCANCFPNALPKQYRISLFASIEVICKFQNESKINLPKTNAHTKQIRMQHIFFVFRMKYYGKNLIHFNLCVCATLACMNIRGLGSDGGKYAVIVWK